MAIDSQMMRLNLLVNRLAVICGMVSNEIDPVLQLAEGWTVDIDPEIHQVLNMRTDPTWPTTWFVPRLCDKPAFRDVYSVCLLYTSPMLLTRTSPAGSSFNFT